MLGLNVPAREVVQVWPDRSLERGRGAVVLEDLMGRIPDVSREEIPEPAPGDPQMLGDGDEGRPVLED
jgi:hypothetical protein